jgi:hypothetical protein
MPGAAPQPLGASPSTPESRRAITAPVSSRLDAAPLPRSISKVVALPRHCALAHGCSSREPSHRSSSRWPPPLVSRRVLVRHLRARAGAARAYAPCGQRRGPSMRSAMGRARPIHASSQLGHASRAHCACGLTTRVSARGRCFK